MSEILFPAISLGLLGLLFGVVLGFASKKFVVKVDKKQENIRQCLPGANCGGCGYSGCDAYAKAVYEGKAEINLCIPGGKKVANSLGKVVGRKVSGVKARKIAFVRCQGICERTKNKSEYYGIRDCIDAYLTPGHGSKACTYGCTGYGTCVKVCKFDAIHVEHGVAVVDESKCTGCGECAAECPKGIIDMRAEKRSVRLTCSSQNRGADVKNNCAYGCIGCGLCMRSCPAQAITMESNLPKIDYSKCYGCEACGICTDKCPTKAMKKFVEKKK